MKLRIKTIRRRADNKLFLIRFALYIGTGSFKVHLIVRDDTDKPHTHPWNYKSLLIIPYKEVVYFTDYEPVLTVHMFHTPFTLVERECKVAHKTTLYRIFGIPIPAITIGRYSDKKQLCSFCTKLGHCMNNPPKGEPAWDI